MKVAGALLDDGERLLFFGGRGVSRSISATSGCGASPKPISRARGVPVERDEVNNPARLAAVKLQLYFRHSDLTHP
jgi:hypothetical protein